MTGKWNTNADIGIYRFNSTGGGAATVGDALGEDASRTESGTLTNLAAGTYYIALAYYAGTQPVPTTIQLRFTRTN